MAINIKIKNLRNTKPESPWDFKIDRSSPVGNPFNMHGEGYRDNVCDEYDEWFPNQIEDSFNGPFNQKLVDYLDKIYAAYKKYGQVNLFCWCSPKRCHGETIRNYLLKRLKI